MHFSSLFTEHEKENFKYKDLNQDSLNISPTYLRQLPTLAWETLFEMEKPRDPTTGKRKGKPIPHAPAELTVNLLRAEGMQAIATPAMVLDGTASASSSST